MLGVVDPREMSKKLLGSATNKLDQVVRSPETAKKVSGLEQRYSEHRREAHLEEGKLRGVRVIVHRGWVAQDQARVYLRVVESPRLPDEGSRIPYWDVLATNLRRHGVLSFPDVPVRVRLGDAVADGVTDRQGYASVVIDVPGLPPGWHEVEVTTHPDGGDGQFTGSGRVLKPDPAAPFAVISDIDDTVLLTGLAEGVVALRRTLFRDAQTRRAVPGMASLYRGLERGIRPREDTPQAHPSFFYLSTGSWSFYEMLTQFLQLRGYPRGPLFLTNWGPSDRYLRRSGEEHKKLALTRLREGYPDLPFVLIGDSGQKDGQIYLGFAQDHPDAVAAVVIVKAGDSSAERTQELREASAVWRADGVPFFVADDAAEAAGILHDLGMVDDVTLEEVDTELGAVF